MKPIEPGCLALFTGSVAKVGKAKGCYLPARVVTISCAAEAHFPCSTCNRVDRTWRFPEENSYTGFARACECKLIRIDGDPDEQGIVQIYDEDVTA